MLRRRSVEIDQKKKAQITFSPGSHEDSKGRLGSLHHE